MVREGEEVYFLAWGCPWPPMSGGDLRTLDLIKEISKGYKVCLVLLLLKPLETSQLTILKGYTSKILPLTLYEKRISSSSLMFKMMSDVVPYHCALLRVLFKYYPDLFDEINKTEKVVYASYGHWGTLCKGSNKDKWILDQHNADIDFWRVYSNQNDNKLMKLFARINWIFARLHFPTVYRNVGKIVSVCEEDRLLTLKYCPNKEIDIIENGIDCDYYLPSRNPSAEKLVLFTGTSARRNVVAIKYFVKHIFPFVLDSEPYAKLIIAGNFDDEAKNEIHYEKNIIFTGPVEDMRPIFNKSSVFIAPFKETHGSKLKIAEAMAMGMPIVSTPEGIRGFKLINGRSVLTARDDKEFALHILEVLKNRDYGEKIGVRARIVAKKTIDWSILGGKVREIIAGTS